MCEENWGNTPTTKEDEEAHKQELARWASDDTSSDELESVDTEVAEVSVLHPLHNTLVVTLKAEINILREVCDKHRAVIKCQQEMLDDYRLRDCIDDL